MKALIFLLSFAALPHASPAGILGWFSSQHRDWEFVQRTGGIRIEDARVVEGKKVLPVEYDVSGLSTVTRKPTTMNSGLAVRKIIVSKRNGNLVIKVVTQVVENKNVTGRIHFVDLSAIPPGKYEVFYDVTGDPEKRLGQIEIKP